MRELNQSETKTASGSGLRFNNGVELITPTTNIPFAKCNLIESHLQNVINGSCSEERFFAIMKDNGCMPYLETYFEDLWDENY